jgi:hypothetical protein
VPIRSARRSRRQWYGRREDAVRIEALLHLQQPDEVAAIGQRDLVVFVGAQQIGIAVKVLT